MYLLNVLPLLQHESKVVLESYELIKKLGDFKLIELPNTFQLSDVKITHQFFIHKDKIAISATKFDISDDLVDNVLERISDAYATLDVVDFRNEAEDEVYLQGGYSIVADFKGGYALMAANEMADEDLFEEYCEVFELTPFPFMATNSKVSTAEFIFVGNHIVFVVLDLISDKKFKKQLLTFLKSKGKEIVVISLEQFNLFKFNVVEVYVSDEPILLIGKKMFDHLTPSQQSVLESKSNFKVLDLAEMEHKNLFLRDFIL